LIYEVYKVELLMGRVVAIRLTQDVEVLGFNIVTRSKREVEKALDSSGVRHIESKIFLFY